MLISAVTHTSELFVFGWGPIIAVVLGFAAAFGVIGFHLLRDGNRALWWGALLPSLAIVLGIGNSIRNGSIHPYTIWHLMVDFTVVPICVYHLMRGRTRTP
jgi:hypothetical protein